MSEQSDSREQVEASTEQQELELKDLAVQKDESDQVRGGGTTAPTTKTAAKDKGAIEVTDYGFGVSMPVTSS